LAQNEEESLCQLCSKCACGQAVRYVIADAKTYAPLFLAKAKYIKREVNPEEYSSFHSKGLNIPLIGLGKVYKKSMISRLYAEDGLGLGRYRMVYESKALSYMK
jgi:hypothetical protein